MDFEHLYNKLQKTKCTQFISGKVADIYNFELSFFSSSSSSQFNNKTKTSRFGNKRVIKHQGIQTRKTRNEFAYAEILIVDKDDIKHYVVVSTEFLSIDKIEIGDVLTVIDRQSYVYVGEALDQQYKKNLKGQSVFESMHIMDAVIKHYPNGVSTPEVHYSYSVPAKWHWHAFSSAFGFVFFAAIYVGFIVLYKEYFGRLTPSFSLWIGFSVLGAVFANFLANKRRKKENEKDTERFRSFCALLTDKLELNYEDYTEKGMAVSDTTANFDKEVLLPSQFDLSNTVVGVQNYTAMQNNAKCDKTISRSLVFKVVKASISNKVQKDSQKYDLHAPSSSETISIENRLIHSEGNATLQFADGTIGSLDISAEIAKLCNPGDTVLYGFSDSFSACGTKFFRCNEYLQNISQNRTFYFDNCAKTVKRKISLFRPFHLVVKLFALRFILFSMLGTFLQITSGDLVGLDIRFMRIEEVLFNIFAFAAACTFIALVWRIVKNSKNLNRFNLIVSPLYKTLNESMNLRN